MMEGSQSQWPDDSAHLFGEEEVGDHGLFNCACPFGIATGEGVRRSMVDWLW